MKSRIFNLSLFLLFLAAFFVFAKARSYAQMPPACTNLLGNYLSPAMNSKCGDTDYDHIADFQYPPIGGDGKVNINDFSFFGSHNTDAVWCQAQIDEFVDPCPAPPPLLAGPPANDWFHTVGGDVYFGGPSNPHVPSEPDYFFSLASLKGDSGIVYYRSSYSEVGDGSQSDPAPPSWFYNVQFDKTNLYNYFKNKIPNEQPYQAGKTVFCNLDTGPANQTTIHDVSTDLTIARSDIGPGGCSMSNLQVSNNKKVIVLVSGNLYINNYIDISGRGFLAFIVAGNIIVHDNLLGGSLSDPAIEGVFITDREFHTGNAADTLYLKGIFMSSRNNNGFNLQRTGPPATRLGEVFIYNSEMLINAPKEIKDVNIDWLEATP